MILPDSMAIHMIAALQHSPIFGVVACDRPSGIGYIGGDVASAQQPISWEDGRCEIVITADANAPYFCVTDGIGVLFYHSIGRAIESGDMLAIDWTTLLVGKDAP